MPTLYYVVSLVIGHGAASLMFYALESEKSLTASAHTPYASLRLLHGMPTYFSIVYGPGYAAFSYHVLV